MGQHHYIKIHPKHFIDVDNGIKTFEIRFNDRNYKVGDILHLREYNGVEYTGRELIREVCYMIDSHEFCKDGFVVLGLKVFIGHPMTFKQFVAWCNERSCDGLWGFNTIVNCICALEECYQAPFWKREKVWQAVNKEHNIVLNFVEPTNRKIEESLRSIK